MPYDVSDGLYQNSVLKMGTHAQDLFLGFNNFKIQGIIHNKKKEIFIGNLKEILITQNSE